MDVWPMPRYWKRGSTVLWLSPEVQYAYYVKEDGQNDDQNDDQEDNSEDNSENDSVYASEHEWSSLASLSLHDGAHQSVHKEAHYKQAQWDAIFKKAESSVLIYNLSIRS